MGQSGYGKSYLAERLIHYSDNFIYFDPTNRVPEKLVEFQGIRFPVAETYSEVLELVGKAEMEDRRIEIIYTPIVECGTKQVDELAQLCMVLDSIDLYLDELHLYMKKTMPPALNELVRLARHYETRIIGISQRYVDMVPDFRTQCERLVTVHQEEPLDLDYFRRFPSPVDKGTLADYVSHLDKLEYYFIK
jgi:hypothetical protein